MSNSLEQEIRAIQAQKLERVQDLDAKLEELRILQQEAITAKLAEMADRTLQMVSVIGDLAEMAMTINAFGKWDVWMSITPHVDWVEVSISRRGNYHDKLWGMTFHYRFSEDKPYYTVENQLEIVSEIKGVLSDFISNDEPERHFRKSY